MISLVVLASMISGLILGFSLIYISKFKEYVLDKRKGGRRYWRLIDVSWRILLPILFAFIALILPEKILCYIIDDKSIVSNLSSVYLFTFVPCLFFFVFLLIKSGKIKIYKKIR